MNDFLNLDEDRSSETNESNPETTFQTVVDENEKLKFENKNLKIQFDQAINISKDLDDLHSKNRDLSAKLKQSELAREELEKRIQLNLITFQGQLDQANKDASLKLNNSQQHINELQEQIKQQNGKAIQDQKEIENRILDAVYKADAESQKAQIVQTKLNKILEVCGSAFHYTFSTPEALISYLEAIPEDQPIIPQRNDDNLKIINKLTKKIQKEQKKRKLLEQNIESAQLQLQTCQHDCDSQINANKFAVAELKGQLQKQETFHNQVVQQYEENLAKVRQDLQNAKSQMAELALNSQNQPQLPPTQIIVDSDNLKEYEQMKKESAACIRRLRNRVNTFQNQLSKSEEEKAKLNQELIQIKDSYGDLQSSFDLQKNQLNMQIKQNEFIENERKAIQEELLKFTTKMEKEENDKINKLHKKLIDSENAKEKLENINVSLQEQLQQMNSQASTLQKQLIGKKKDIVSLQAAIQELQTDNQCLNDKLSAVPKIQTIDELIPRSCFVCQNAPPPLSQSLNELSANGILPPSSKIPMALSLVQSFYTKQIDEMDSEIKDLRQNGEINSHLLSIIKSFITNISRIDCFTYHGEDIGTILNQIESNYQRLYSEKCMNDQTLTEYGMKMGIPLEQLSINSILQFVDDFKDIHNALSHLQSEYKSLKKQNKIAMDESNHDLELARSKLENVYQQKKDMEDQIMKQTEKIHTLELENQNSALQLKSSENAISSQNEKHEYELQQVKSQACREIETMRTNLCKDIEDKERQIKKFKEKIIDLEKTKGLLRKGISVLKEKLAESVRLIGSEKKIKQEEKQRLMKKYEAEKKELQKINEETIGKLQNQCSELRLSMTTINEALQQSEEKNEKLISYLNSCKRQKQKYEEQLAIQAESMERERKIQETQMHAAILNVESKANAEIINTKSALQRENQKLIAFFAEQFRCFFDPMQQIDSHMYYQLVEKSKNELLKLQNSDNAIRRMTNAGPMQATEEAVSQYIFRPTD